MGNASMLNAGEEVALLLVTFSGLLLVANLFAKGGTAQPSRSQPAGNLGLNRTFGMARQ